MAVTCGLLFAGPAFASDRVDPNGDFSNLSQRLIIKYKDDRTRDMLAEARNLSIRGGSNLRFVRSLAVTRHHLFELDERLPRQAIGALLSSLARAPSVELVEEDVLVQAQLTPNDTLYPNQWHYYEASGGINLPPAWDKQTGSGIVVAVLDTGYTEHSDLLDNILPGYDFIDDTFVANDDNGRDDDARDPGDWLSRWDCGFLNPPRAVGSSWHGTHVSGTVAAITNTNGEGVAGVAFDARILPVRVLGKCGGYVSDIADGILWASGVTVGGVPNPNPAQVINMSLSGAAACDATLQTAIDTARTNGTTVVVAAGNSNADAVDYLPANCNGVITVAANDRQGNRASYSNYGTLIDVTAPGGETDQVAADGVASTLNDGATSPGNENYVYYQGTSMAAPHVAGAAALLYATDASITPDDVAAALVATARPLPGSCSGGCGAGIIDANAAIDFVSTGNQAPNAGFTHSENLLAVTFADASIDSDGSVVGWDWDFGDGNTSTTQNPAHTYAANGTYTVTLTVTDDGGATDTASQNVTVDDGTPTNQPPEASFTYLANLLAVTLTDTSDDSDGNIVSWGWTFGDENSSTSQNPAHTYAANGTYTVTLTVTDDGGATGTSSQDVTVTDGSVAILLSTSGYKVRGRQNVDLTWSGATSSNVDIYRNGANIATVPNDGDYTDAINTRGGATYVYKVCEAGTGTCSNESTVVF
jgi:serine protease